MNGLISQLTADKGVAYETLVEARRNAAPTEIASKSPFSIAQHGNPEPCGIGLDLEHLAYLERLGASAYESTFLESWNAWQDSGNPLHLDHIIQLAQHIKSL